MEPVVLCYGGMQSLQDDAPKATLYYGAHVLDTLRSLPDESVHVVCTSPPYYGLRSYDVPPQVWGGDILCDHEWDDPIDPIRAGGSGVHTGDAKRVAPTVEGQHYGQTCRKCSAWLGHLGLEPTPWLYIEHLVQVFAEVRRVLRSDGTLWLNLGDSFVNDAKWGGATSGKHAAGVHGQPVGRTKRVSGLGPKNLLGVPWRVAFALQDDGWTLRNDIVWSKENPLPESVRDRCTRSHEYIFHLAKNPRYFHDADAIKEPFADPSVSGWRNKRTVWTVNPKPYPGAHFAVWPEDLVEPMVKAGSSEKGCCASCKTPWRRMTWHGCEHCGEPVRTQAKECPKCGHVRDWKEGRDLSEDFLATDYSTPGRGVPRLPGNFQNKTLAGEWEPGCSCGTSEVARCTVMDIFSGSATTGAVALRLGRDYIGIDLSATYLPLAEARLLTRPAPVPVGDPVQNLSELFS